MTRPKNLFCTVLTHAAPSSNYRGESESNRTVLQKITRGDEEYAIVSPEAMRNALREILADMNMPVNRRRLRDEDQPAVEFMDFPDATRFADDFLFGFMVADAKKVQKLRAGRPTKRDSVLRMNMAVALSPYRHEAVFNQSPKNAGESPWANSGSSALLHREVTYTAFQYPLAIPGRDALQGQGPEWTRALLSAVGQLTGVAGAHARSYFEMAPRSVVARLTPRLVAGFDTYGFDESGGFADLARVRAGDVPGHEMYVGGALARDMAAEERERLLAEGATFRDDPAALLSQLGAKLTMQPVSAPSAETPA